MSAVYTIIILALFALGMPVAFVLMLGGVLGMLFFLGGPAAFTQIPVIAYKTLDDFVLVAVPLYILMSEILLKGKVGNGLFELGSKWLGCRAASASRQSSPAQSLPRYRARAWRRP
jgi:C4-dicarboxylate transporter DctM subunit